MSHDQDRTSGSPSGDARTGYGFRDAWNGRARWQQIAAIASLILTLGSGVLVAISGRDGAPAPSNEATTARNGEATRALDDGSFDRELIAPGLAPDGLWEGPLPPLPGGADEAEDESADGAPPSAATGDPGGPGEVQWSPALFKTGFSFFMGFALAFAVRSFVRISLVAVGMMGLMLFGLEYMGLVTVEWGAMADRWDGMLSWLQPQLTSFQGFITGQLPSAAAATGGLVTGWRRG